MMATFWSVGYACSPAKLTPQQIVDRADLIVIGLPVKSTWSSWDNEPTIVNRLAELYRQIAREIRYVLGDEEGIEFFSGRTKFKVVRTIKGDQKKYLTVKHHVDGATCGVTFSASRPELLLLRDYQGGYTVDIFGVRPWLSDEEYREFVGLIGLTSDDDVPSLSAYMELEKTN